MKRILVVGDVIKDVYRDGFFVKWCPDAPTVPVVVTRHVNVFPGGAANVAMNIASLRPAGVEVDLMGVFDLGMATRMVGSGVGLHPTFGTVVAKERVMMDGTKLVRLDEPTVVERADRDLLAKSLRDYLQVREPDLIVYSDYGCGTVGPEASDILFRHRDRLLVDTKDPNLRRFGGGLGVKLNWGETRAAKAQDDLWDQLFSYTVSTMGALGVSLTIFKRDPSGSNPHETVTHNIRIPGHRIDPIDPCGCGDTFMAGFAVELVAGSDAVAAAEFANAAAAVAATRHGTAVVQRAEALEMRDRGRTA